MISGWPDSDTGSAGSVGGQRLRGAQFEVFKLWHCVRGGDRLLPVGDNHPLPPSAPAAPRTRSSLPLPAHHHFVSDICHWLSRQNGGGERGDGEEGGGREREGYEYGYC